MEMTQTALYDEGEEEKESSASNLGPKEALVKKGPFYPVFTPG